MNQNDFYIDLFCSRASDIFLKKYFVIKISSKTILSHIKKWVSKMYLFDLVKKN